MDVDGLWIALFPPGLPRIFILADQFFLFGINRDHRALVFSVPLYLRVNIVELLVPVRMYGSFERFDVGLEAVAQFMEEGGHGGMTERVALLAQGSSQLARTLTRPPQGRHGISTRQGLHQGFQRFKDSGLPLHHTLAPTSRVAGSHTDLVPRVAFRETTMDGRPRELRGACHLGHAP